MTLTTSTTAQAVIGAMSEGAIPSCFASSRPKAEPSIPAPARDVTILGAF
jgi:hypothetical protein